MQIPLNAQVECTDGVCGRSVFALLNPVIDQVTHLVVKEDFSPNAEYIVSVDFVAETMVDMIRLRCSKAELEKMDPFIKTSFIEEKVPADSIEYGGGSYEMGSYYYTPNVTSEITAQVPVEYQQIPHGELAVRRGTRVESTDGYIGKINEFVVDPENCHITYWVMEGHLWGKKDVNIPLSAMCDTRDDTVFLKFDKHQIESLPTFPVRTGAGPDSWG